MYVTISTYLPTSIQGPIRIKVKDAKDDEEEEDEDVIKRQRDREKEEMKKTDNNKLANPVTPREGLLHSHDGSPIR